jgi:hypothetical protein
LVGYPGDFHTAYNNVSFKLNKAKGVNVNVIAFRAVGNVKVLANGKLVYTSSAKEGLHTIHIPRNILVKSLQIDLATTGEPGGILVLSGPFSTSNKTWQWKSDQELWQLAYKFPQLSTNEAPHRQGLQRVPVNPVSSQNGIYDFGRELLGYINLPSSTLPEIGIGESISEALYTVKKTLEQTNELMRDGTDRWRSLNRLFRPIYVQDIILAVLIYMAVKRNCCERYNQLPKWLEQTNFTVRSQS